MNEIYSREQKRLALTFNVFMKVSFMHGRLIVNKIKALGFICARGPATRQGQQSQP
jgi:hypothetical protein